jgi:hypothetical protein
MVVRRSSVVILPALMALVLHPAFAQQPYTTRQEAALSLLSAPPTLTQSSAMAGEGRAGKKSVGLAAIYSLILPGAGEFYTDSFSSGKYFFGAEAVLWLTYAAFDVYGTTLQRDARTYAAVHAGVSAPGKTDKFYVDVGNFLTVDAYNAQMLRNRTPELLYDAATGLGWGWDSEGNRATYRNQNVRGQDVLNNRKFVVAAVLINHVASAINAARAAIAHNKESDGTLGSLQFETSVMGGWRNPQGILFTITRSL